MKTKKLKKFKIQFTLYIATHLYFSDKNRLKQGQGQYISNSINTIRGFKNGGLNGITILIKLLL